MRLNDKIAIVIGAGQGVDEGIGTGLMNDAPAGPCRSRLPGVAVDEANVSPPGFSSSAD